MYVIATHIPAWFEGGSVRVVQDWFHDLSLTRESLGDALGELVVLAPRATQPLEGWSQDVVEVPADAGIRVVPTYRDGLGPLSFARSGVRSVREALLPLLPRAAAVQASVTLNVARPLSFHVIRLARRGGVPVIAFGTDQDPWWRSPEWSASPRSVRWKRIAGDFCVDRLMGHAARHASLLLLKEGGTLERYGRLSEAARGFCHTSHRESDLVPAAAVAGRLESLASGRPIRLVYCGRLVRGKGIHRSIALLAEANARGARYEFDVIGDGPERQALEAQARDHAANLPVAFRGRSVYGPALLRRLAEYDGLLFTPFWQETPRMVYDGYCAALPLLATGIPFVQHRIATDGAGVVLPAADDEEATRLLLELSRERERWGPLTEEALAAGRNHTAERWYAKRRAWILAALGRAGEAPADASQG